MATTTIVFPPFELDVRAGQLRRDGQPIALRPKAFALLQHMAERPGELLTKQALLAAVWKDTTVTEDVVRLSAGQLRAALGDQRAAPRFIETVARRGYRFIAQVGASPAPDPAGVFATELAPGPRATARSWFVGRERERGVIAGWLAAALRGARQVGLVAGEAGIGKTTLVDTALRDLQRTAGTALCVARGQCIERYGGGAPYLPVLQAIASLRRRADAAEIDLLLQRHAPRWLLPATGGVTPGSEVDPATSADSHEHTLQMLSATLDAIAARVPVVLVLEDVHWSDFSTLDLLSALAQRRDPARLLVLCTLRPVDAIAAGHPVARVARELVRKGLCHELRLDGLPAADLARHLAARFEEAALPAELLPLLVERSDGNPFLAVALVDHLLASGMLAASAAGWQLHGGEALRETIPDGLSAMIEPKLERLTRDELHVLEGASVAGPEFAAHLVAAVTPAGPLADVEQIEQLCDGLAHRQDILRSHGEVSWPDGTISARYSFRHVLYQQVIERRIAPSKRRRLHQAIGERLEAGHAGRTEEVASALAAHFDASRDVERAIRYHHEAAAHAGSRLALRELRVHLKAALELLQGQPESGERLRRELPLLHELGWTSLAVDSWGDPEAFVIFSRMRALAERLEVPEMRLRALESLRGLHSIRAQYDLARDLGEETMALATELRDTAATGAAHVDLASALIHLGALDAAREHAARGLALVDPATLHGIAARVLLAGAAAHSGAVTRSIALCDEALACAAATGVPYLAAFAAMHAAWSTLHLHDVARTRSLATAAARVAAERGFAVPRTYAAIFLGWCDVEEGRPEAGRAAIEAGLAELYATGERTSTTNWQALLVRAHLACGEVARATEVLDGAFAFLAETGERIVEHELHRLRAACLLAGRPSPDRRARAAAHLERAIAIAAARKAALFELRAAASLLHARGSGARERVTALLPRFDAANDCADARRARSLLATGR